MTDPLLGSIIGERYRLGQVIGQGGMGVVYRAEDVRLAGRPCAVKLLMGTSMDPDEGQRFERELAIISRLRSNHVVQVLDTGMLPDGRRFIVMELLEGAPLSSLLKQVGFLEPRRAVKLVKGVLAGLSEAHEWGIIHRDLKPANVFVTQARTGEEIGKVLDFGIAKDTHSVDSELTAASMLIGTPKYMAPEQFLKHGASTRTDLYAVGLLLYQALCGRPPFLPGDEVADNIKMMPDEFRVGWLHVHQAPAPLDIDPQLWAIVEMLLAKDPEARFADANGVIEALSQWEGIPIAPVLPTVADQPIVSAEISSTTGFPVMGESMSVPIQIARPRKTGLWVALGALIVIGGAAAFWFAKGPTEGTAPTTAAAAKAPDCVTRIVTTPPKATVMMGATDLGQTPVEVKRPCKEQWLLDLKLLGFKPQRTTLKGRNLMSTLSLSMEPIAAATPSAASEAPKPAPVTAAPKKTKKTTRRGRTRTKTKTQPARRPKPVKTRAPASKAPPKAPATKAPATLPF